MKNLEKGLVPASKAPAKIHLSFNPAYLSRNEMRATPIPDPRPVMFVNSYGETEPYADIGEAIADVANDKDLPKGTLMYVNGGYRTLKEAAKLADSLKPYHYKRSGRDAPTHKFQFWTDAAAAKFGLAYGTEATAEATPTAKKAKGAKKARY